MGSVIDYIECPNCNQPGCSSDFYYRTGEEYLFCQICGYNKSVTIKNRDKKYTELTDEDWEINEILNPYASFTAKYKSSNGYSVGSVTTKENLKEIAEDISNDDDLESLIISRFIDGKIITFDLKRQFKLKKIMEKFGI